MKPSEAAREFLDSREISYGVGIGDEESETIFFFRARGNCCGMLVRLSAVDERSILRVHAFGGARVNIHAVAEVERLFAWANTDDPFGRFILYRATGETCYATVIKRIRGEITPAAVGRIVEVAATRFDRIHPTLSRIILNFEKAERLIPFTETPTWVPVMRSMKEDLKGLVVVKPDARIPGRALTVGHVALFIGDPEES